MPLFFDRSNTTARLLDDDGTSKVVSRAEAETLLNGRPRPEILVGLDLGTVDDYSALAIVEVADRMRAGHARYSVVHLERWRQMPYPSIAEEVLSIMRSPRLAGAGAELLVDATGCGLPVIQMMQRMGLHCLGVTITAGDVAGSNAAGLTVPKTALVGALQVVVQSQRLKVAPQLPSGRLLAAEMSEFQRRQNPVTGRNQFATWREGAHDDLTLSVCLPVWRAECTNPVRFI